MDKWIKAETVNGYYLQNKELVNINTDILVTYETFKGRTYVTKVECNHGRITKKLAGDVTAFMFLPEPYKGE